MVDAVLRTLAVGGGLGAKLATIIQRLVLDGGQLGELEAYEYLDAGGDLATGKKLPRRWLDRLDEAIETGAIECLSIDRIVEIMLIGPR